VYLACATVIAIVSVAQGTSVGRAMMIGLGIWPVLIVYVLWMTSRNRALTEPIALFPDDEERLPPRV
jgi:hypothetical protein